MAHSRGKVLVLTVGTGNVDDLDRTLFTPLRKSIAFGEWAAIVFLPSQVTQEYADRLRTGLGPMEVRVAPLPEAGQEDDANACFIHFDLVIAGLREEGFGPADIMADFTRGTKVMSAALVLVAARHGLPMLRYITGRRDQRGLVIPGEETVHEVRTSVIGESRLLDNARAFFIAGDFGAVLSLLPDPSDTRGQSPYVTMADAALGIRRMAAFYAAWDRLDYRAAAAVDLDGAPVALPEWQRLRPANAKRAWVSRLAQPAPEAPREKAALLRFLAADLLANGERRIRHCQYEDAIIRAYRILELVGQIRLFDRGLDSSDLDPKLPAGRGISKFRDAAQSGQRVKASRDDVVRLLEHLNDPLWRRLANLANAGAITAESRNHSVLIHGFTALGLPDEQPLHILFSQLADLLQADHPGAAERLAIARSVNLGAIDG